MQKKRIPAAEALLRNAKTKAGYDGLPVNEEEQHVLH